MKSRVHPKYKTKYLVKNWATYDSALVQRVDLTIWLSPEPITAWKPASARKRGGQLKFSDIAIETALALRLSYRLPVRQSEGFMNSIFAMMGIDQSAIRNQVHFHTPATSAAPCFADAAGV